eukprot:TRINITY_DN8331_c0_g1_i1.p1 TRINITY_DN8331_c0_g1~~TRINITY_DN8331_c0_g1_i1.p1  ORF type:complete len:169 (+),score=18.82 TRINITY_DN8331_c0_g1_i1:143-649(+)
MRHIRALESGAQAVLQAMLPECDLAYDDGRQVHCGDLPSIGIMSKFICYSHGGKGGNRCNAQGDCACAAKSNVWASPHTRLFMLHVPSEAPGSRGRVYLWISSQECKNCRYRYERPAPSDAEVAKKLEWLINRTDSTGWAQVSRRRRAPQPHKKELCELCHLGLCRAP